MRQVFLMLLSVMVSNAAVAEFAPIGTDDKSVVFFVRG